jgi:O-antigen/teichoic acid export membrane protein
MVRDLIIAFYVAEIFGKSILGYYVYSTMMLSIPISVIGQSFGQVFYQRVSKLFSESKDIFNPLFKTFVLLFLIAIIPFSILYFWGGNIFSFVFGNDWKIAGQYSEILSIWMFFNFILSPISNVLIVLNKQKQNFYLGLVSTLGQIICFILLPFFNNYYKSNFTSLLWVLSISQAFISIIGVIFIFRCSYRIGK